MKLFRRLYPSVLPAWTLTDTSAAGALDVSVDGPLDWFATTGLLTRVKTYAHGTLFSKASGGWIADSFEWVCAGLTSNLAVFAVNPPKTAPNADSTASTVLNTGNTSFITSNSGAALHQGWRFRVPADITPRRLRVYTWHFSCELTMSATLKDDSGLAISSSVDFAAAASGGRRWETIYRAARPCDLEIVADITQNHISGTINAGFVCATLAAA